MQKFFVIFIFLLLFFLLAFFWNRSLLLLLLFIILRLRLCLLILLVVHYGCGLLLILDGRSRRGVVRRRLGNEELGGPHWVGVVHEARRSHHHWVRVVMRRVRAHEILRHWVVCWAYEMRGGELARPRYDRMLTAQLIIA